MLELNFNYLQFHWILILLFYKKKPNIRSFNRDPFVSDIENIHLACQTRDESYDSILINRKDRGKYRQLFTHNVLVKKITYKDKDFK